MRFYHRIICPKHADGMANSMVPDHTDCPDLSVRKLTIITVNTEHALTKVNSVLGITLQKFQ